MPGAKSILHLIVFAQEEGTAQPCMASELIAQSQTGENNPNMDDIIKDVTGTAYSGKQTHSNLVTFT
jgi:hypothetical protein